MGAAHVELVAYESNPPGDPVWHFATVDLQRPRNFVAWTSTGYVNGKGEGAWDFDNCYVAEIYMVDGNRVPYDSWGAKLGPEGALTNLHQMSYVGFGQTITFRLRVWQTEEMEVATRGIVLYDI